MVSKSRFEERMRMIAASIEMGDRFELEADELRRDMEIPLAWNEVGRRNFGEEFDMQAYSVYQDFCLLPEEARVSGDWRRWPAYLRARALALALASEKQDLQGAGLAWSSHVANQRVGRLGVLYESILRGLPAIPDTEAVLHVLKAWGWVRPWVGEPSAKKGV